MELLKQDQYVPLPVEKQVLIVFAGTNGYVDKLPVESLKEFESELYRYIDEKAPDIWEDIRKTRDLGDETKKKVEKALKAFTKSFVASKENADDAPKKDKAKKRRTSRPRTTRSPVLRTASPFGSAMASLKESAKHQLRQGDAEDHACHEMVAAARLARASNASSRSVPTPLKTAEMLAEVTSALAETEANSPDYPLLARRPEKRALILVITSDSRAGGCVQHQHRSRASAFGAEKEQAGVEVRIATIGRKGRSYSHAEKHPFSTTSITCGIGWTWRRRASSPVRS